MQIWKVEPNDEASLGAAIRSAASQLRSGGLVAFPTETVYGLGANAWDDSAVRRIFAAKGRPADNPLIVHVAGSSMLGGVAVDGPLPPAVRRAMRAFWPGPLTLLLPAHPRLAPSVHPGVPTVGVRCPDHPVALRLIAEAGCPVAAPSANRSGRPSPTTARDVLEDLGDAVDGLLDAGPSTVGVESTVAWVREREVVVLRPGWITPDDLAQALGLPARLDTDPVGGSGTPLAPGMKYRHYAPDAMVHVWWGEESAVRRAMEAYLKQLPANQAALVTPGWRPGAGEPLAVWTPAPGERYDVALAREMYRLLRAFDREGARHVLIHGVAPTGLGAAVMNRLAKAAEGRVVAL